MSRPPRSVAPYISRSSGLRKRKERRVESLLDRLHPPDIRQGGEWRPRVDEASAVGFFDDLDLNGLVGFARGHSGTTQSHTEESDVLRRSPDRGAPARLRPPPPLRRSSRGRTTPARGATGAGCLPAQPRRHDGAIPREGHPRREPMSRSLPGAVPRGEGPRLAADHGRQTTASVSPMRSMRRPSGAAACSRSRKSASNSPIRSPNRCGPSWRGRTPRYELVGAAFDDFAAGNREAERAGITCITHDQFLAAAGSIGSTPAPARRTGPR